MDHVISLCQIPCLDTVQLGENPNPFIGPDLLLAYLLSTLSMPPSAQFIPAKLAFFWFFPASGSLLEQPPTWDALLLFFLLAASPN